MEHSLLKEQVVNLIMLASEEHVKGLVSENDENSDWPIWYANYLRVPLGKLLLTDFTRSQLIFCLMTVDYEFEVANPEVDKFNYFADHFIEHFAPTPNTLPNKLGLYYSPYCPYCTYVLEVVERLNIKVEMFNIQSHSNYREELITARNRGTVPVLKITSADGRTTLMPESRDIINYLEKNYG